MHRFSSLTLTQKLVSALAVFGLLPAIFIAWTTYQTASKAMTDDVGKAFTQSAVTRSIATCSSATATCRPSA